MRIVLIGPPAAGKSRSGRRLARALEASYADTDRLIQAEHGPIREIFAARGESGFRELERATVAQALEDFDVVSLGGGAVMDPATQERILGSSAHVVYLTVRPEAVAERIANDKRPLIRSLDDWRAVVEGRRDTYERLATMTVDTSFRPMRRVIEQILEQLAAIGAIERRPELPEPEDAPLDDVDDDDADDADDDAEFEPDDDHEETA